MIEQDENKGFNEEDFTHYICEGIKKDIAARKEFDTQIVDRAYKDWRDIRDKKLWPWQGCANWSVPITSLSIDSIAARLNEGILDINPPIDVKPMNKTSEQYRDVIKQFLNWDLKSHPELLEQLWFFILNTVIYGTGFSKNYFCTEKEMEERDIEVYIIDGEVYEDPNTGMPLEVNSQNSAKLLSAGVEFVIEETVEKRENWKKYHPVIETWDIKDVLFPEDTETILDAYENSHVALRFFATKDFLRRQLKQGDKELYKNLNKVKIKELEAKREYAEDERKRQQITDYYEKTKKIEFFEWIGNYDVDNDGLEEKVVAIVNLESKQLLGWELYPYDHGRCPVVAGYIKPIHKQPLGVGVAEMLFDTKGMIDAEQNARTDRNALNNNPPLTYTKESGFNPKIHKKGPGRHWLLNERSEASIGYLPTPVTEFNSKDEQDRLFSIAQKRVGVTDNILGDVDRKNQTASGIMALIREGNIGFRNFIRWISVAITEMMQQRLALYQQYWGKNTDPEIEQWILQILDTPGNPLGAEGLEAMRQEFNIVITATKEDKNLELSKAQATYDVALNNPLFQQAPFALREITIDLLKRIGHEDAESKVPTQEQIMQMQVDIQKEALRQMQEEQAKKNVEQAEQAGYQAEVARHDAEVLEEQQQKERQEVLAGV